MLKENEKKERIQNISSGKPELTVMLEGGSEKDQKHKRKPSGCQCGGCNLF